MSVVKDNFIGDLVNFKRVELPILVCFEQIRKPEKFTK